MTAPGRHPDASPDVIVVGSGIAGLTAALHASGGGCRVTLVTKDELEHANTRYAQGGIAAVLFDDDRIEDHIEDTLTAGAGLADPDAVRMLAEEGPARIRELVELGVAFDRAADGSLAKGLEAAHSYPRVVHAGGDATGLAIEKALVARVRAAGIDVVEHAFLVDLVVRDGRVAGVELLVDGRAGRREADAVVLATGGAGQLYRYTTNPSVATGDGIAAAIRAGAEVRDLEFVQFHPTVLVGTAGAAPGGSPARDRDTAGAAPGGSPARDRDTAGAGTPAPEPFLVSEAVRGEGAILVDESGRRFAFDAHPDGELAPRDVVARAMARQIAAQDGRPVFLDATALGAEMLAHRFPTIDRAVRERGMDWTRTPIPVAPAAHYLMGGVVTDLDGRTSVPGLYAVGEVARTGVHGANRLASNSLLEGAVFGARAGDAVARSTAAHASPHRDPIPEPAPDSRESSGGSGDEFGRAGEPDPFSRRALQELMWADAGLVRDAAGLRHAASVIAAWRAQPRGHSTVEELEDDNLLLVAEHVVAAGLARRESVGAHFRSDDTPEPQGAVSLLESIGAR